MCGTPPLPWRIGYQCHTIVCHVSMQVIIPMNIIQGDDNLYISIYENLSMGHHRGQLLGHARALPRCGGCRGTLSPRGLVKWPYPVTLAPQHLGRVIGVVSLNAGGGCKLVLSHSQGQDGVWASQCGEPKECRCQDNCMLSNVRCGHPWWATSSWLIWWSTLQWQLYGWWEQHSHNTQSRRSPKWRNPH